MMKVHNLLSPISNLLHYGVGMKKLTIFVTFFLLLAAVGCGGGGGAEPAAQSQPGAASADAASANRLSADFASDALSV